MVKAAALESTMEAEWNTNGGLHLFVSPDVIAAENSLCTHAAEEGHRAHQAASVRVKMAFEEAMQQGQSMPSNLATAQQDAIQQAVALQAAEDDPMGFGAGLDL